MTDARPTNASNQDEPSRQFMSLASDEAVRFWTIRCVVHSVIVACLIFIAAMFFDWLLLVFSVIVLAIGVAQVIVGRATDWLFNHPSFRTRPLLTVSGKLVEFDIPQLFLPGSQFHRRLYLGSREQRHIHVTIVSACRWDLSADSRKLFVTARLPVWGPFKMRLKTEWDIPDFAMDRWVEFVSKVNRAE